MAKVLIDGMDLYGSVSDAALKGWTIATPANCSIQTSGGKFGGGALRVGNSSAQLDISNLDTVWIAGYLRFSALPGSDLQFLSLINSSSVNQINFRLSSTGQIKVYGGGSSLKLTTSPIIGAGNYYYFEIRSRVNSAGYIQMWIDGNLVCDLTGNFSVAFATWDIQFPTFQGSASVDIDIDDLLIWDETGSGYWTTRIGQKSVQTIRPSGAGSVTNFTPSAGLNYQNVDDSPGNNGDTDYNESNTATDEDLFATDDVGSGTVNIVGIEATVIAKDSDGSGRGLKASIKSGTTTDRGSETLLPTNYVRVAHFLEQDPDAAADWDETSVNAIEHGYQVSS